MKFVDEAEIHVRAGDGGRGCVAFRREPFVPRGGPSGGNGGPGGDVIVEADGQLHTLLDFKFQQHHRAESGGHGGGGERSGKAGADLVLRVPIGTVVRDASSGDVLADLGGQGERAVVARGGRGGRGNKFFANAVRQAPDFAEPGTQGEERRIAFELKVVADVGLLGYPNVGKSTLISRVSAARPKVADYPFTTLTPHLGVVRHGPGRSFVMADIPGLIPGAHEGAGLGHRFLRHVERTRMLLHLITVSYDDAREPVADFECLCEELRLYDAELAKRPQIVVLSQIDRTEVRAIADDLKRVFETRGLSFFAVSAVTGEGIDALIHAVAKNVLGDESGGA
jgi:GTP-binding protein